MKFTNTWPGIVDPLEEGFTVWIDGSITWCIYLVKTDKGISSYVRNLSGKGYWEQGPKWWYGV